MNHRLLNVTDPLGRATHALIAAAFLVVMPGVVPSSLGDCPHHGAHRDQHNSSHGVAGHDAEPGETTLTPCMCIGSCQSSRPIALPNGDSDRSSFDCIIEIETYRPTTPVLMLVSYRIPYAHGPPQQL